MAKHGSGLARHCEGNVKRRKGEEEQGRGLIKQSRGKALTRNELLQKSVVLLCTAWRGLAAEKLSIERRWKGTARRGCANEW